MENALYLIDFDDTLFFTGKCISLAGKELFGKKISRSAARKLSHSMKNRLYRIAFSKYYLYSEPNRMMHKKLESMKGSRIILSARLPEDRKYMVKLLERHKIRYDRLVTRKNSNSADEKWKLMMVKKYQKSYRDVVIYEDKPDNARYIANGAKGVHVFLVSRKRIRELS